MEISPHGDFQLVGPADDGRNGASPVNVIELAHDHGEAGRELERRGSQWGFPIFGSRRERSSDP